MLERSKKSHFASQIILLMTNLIANLQPINRNVKSLFASENYNNTTEYRTQHLITTSYLPPPLAEGFFYPI